MSKEFFNKIGKMCGMGGEALKKIGEEVGNNVVLVDINGRKFGSSYLPNIKKGGPEYWDKFEKKLDKGIGPFGVELHPKCISRLKKAIQKFRDEEGINKETDDD